MNYKINVYPLEKPVGSIRAHVTISFNDLICVRGIKIREDDNQKIYVDLPKRSIRSGARGESRLILAPKEEFVGEMFSNIIKTYMSNQTCFMVEDNALETNYKIDAVEVKSNTRIAVVNLTLENCVSINGFSVISGENGFFLSNPALVNSNGEYKDIAYPLTSEFRQNILDNSLLLLDNIKLDDVSQKKLDNLRKDLQLQKDNLKMVNEFMRETYEKINENITEVEEKNYMDTLGLAAYSVFECEDKIKQLKEEIIKINQKSSHRR